MLPHKSSSPHRRTGFTLVEIMVVIVIIGILAAILVPVLGGIIRRTNEAAVKVEINSLESAISDFKTRFGCVPPDHIFLYENPIGWKTDPESRAKIIKIWPRFSFVGTAAFRDLNNNGNTTEYFVLSGAECLVFFLGGMSKNDGNDGIFMTGFSKNPLDPLRLSTNVNESRDGPFFEFPSSRLVDVEVDDDGNRTGDKFYEFIDTLSNQTAPYLYLSSNEGRGFSPEGGLVFHSNPLLPTVHPSTRPSLDMWPEIATDKTPHWNRTLPYRQSAGGLRWNAKTFQIISPGFGPHENAEGQFCPYGISEVYDPENTNLLDSLDADNITNFSAGGRLRP